MVVWIVIKEIAEDDSQESIAAVFSNVDDAIQYVDTHPSKYWTYRIDQFVVDKDVK